MKEISRKMPYWERMAALIASEIEKKVKPERRFLKSAEVRQMLGGISAAKLQSLRIGGHIPAVNADGLWLYEYEDVINFTDKNKRGVVEDARR
jgi:hypothetical protein